MISSTCSFEYMWKGWVGVTAATSTFVELSFSSMTCFKIVNADFIAPFSVID